MPDIASNLLHLKLLASFIIHLALSKSDWSKCIPGVFITVVIDDTKVNQVDHISQLSLLKNSLNQVL